MSNLIITQITGMTALHTYNPVQLISVPYLIIKNFIIVHCEQFSA